MDASIVAPRIIVDDIQKFFASSNLCQDGSGRLFLFVYVIVTALLLPYIYKIVYKLFNQNPLLWKFFIIFVCCKVCIRK